MSGPSPERLRAHREARRRYWDVHDKHAYECPDCGDDLAACTRFDVHHKDRDPFNNALENLVGLCHHCHRMRHKREYTRENVADWKASLPGTDEATGEIPPSVEHYNQMANTITDTPRFVTDGGTEQ